MNKTLIQANYQTSEVDKKPEIDLLLCCARTSIDLETAEEIKTLLHQDIDWTFLIQTASRYEVLPLLYHSLTTTCSEVVPQNILIRLRDSFQVNSFFNQFRIKELLELLQLFETNKIFAIPFKGPVLAASVYGNIALRQFGDLDILVRKSDYHKAIKILISQDYQLTKKYSLKLIELGIYQFSSSSAFVKDNGNIFIDIHRRIISPYLFSASLNFEHLWKRLQSVSYNQKSLPNLHPEDLLIYLSLHGSDHFFSKLKWICDIAELLQNQDIDWRELVEQAKKIGGERILLLGLFLAKDLLSATLPEIIIKKIDNDPEIPFLVAQVYKRLFLNKTNPSTKNSIQRELRYRTEKFNFLFRAMERPQDRIYLCFGYLFRYARVFVNQT